MKFKPFGQLFTYGGVIRKVHFGLYTRVDHGRPLNLCPSQLFFVLYTISETPQHLTP